MESDNKLDGYRVHALELVERAETAPSQIVIRGAHRKDPSRALILVQLSGTGAMHPAIIGRLAAADLFGNEET